MGWDSKYVIIWYPDKTLLRQKPTTFENDALPSSRLISSFEFSFSPDSTCFGCLLSLNWWDCLLLLCAYLGIYKHQSHADVAIVGWVAFRHPRSLKVIGTDPDWLATYNFLLVPHGPILYRFWDKRRFRSKIANFSTTICVGPRRTGDHGQLIARCRCSTLRTGCSSVHSSL